MPFIHGKAAVFKIQNSSGVLTDISAYTTKSGLSQSVEKHDVTTHGKNSKVMLPGLKDGSVPVEGKYDPAGAAILQGILGIARNFEYFPAGTTTGNPKYSGSCFLESLEIETPVGGEATFKGSIQCSDDITFGTAP